MHITDTFSENIKEKLNTWVCSYRQQEKIAHEREDIERQRKILQKRKPPTKWRSGKETKNYS